MPIVFPLGHWYGNISRPMRNMRGLLVEIPSGGAAAINEHLLFWTLNATLDNTALRYWNIDEDAGTKDEIATFERTPSESTLCSVCTDGQFVFIPQNFGDFGPQCLQIGFDGTDLIPLLTADTGSSADAAALAKLANHDGYFITAAQEGGSTDFNAVSYLTSPPLAFAYTPSGVAPTYTEICDFRYGNPGSAEYGDAIAAAPYPSRNWMSFSVSGATLTNEDTLFVGSGIRGSKAATGWCRDSGLVACSATASTNIKLYQVSMSDLSLSSIGTGTATNNVWAVGVTDDEIIVTVEDTGGATDIIRTYSRVGAVLTEEDSYSLNDAVSLYRAVVRVNPYTGRVYVQTNKDADGLLILDVAADGTITALAAFPNYAIPNAFSTMAFLPGPLSPEISLPAGYLVDDYGIPLSDDAGNYLTSG